METKGTYHDQQDWSKKWPKTHLSVILGPLCPISGQVFFLEYLMESKGSWHQNDDCALYLYAPYDPKNVCKNSMKTGQIYMNE